MTAYFERQQRGPQGTAPRSTVTLAQPIRRNNIAEFDAEMRAKGSQKPEPPQDATVRQLNELIAEKRNKPLTQQDTNWRLEWERRYASIVASAQKDGHGAAPNTSPGSPSQSHAVDETALAKALEDVDPSLRPRCEKLIRATDAEGYAPASAFAPELLSGYTLPADLTYDTAPEMIEGLAAARAAGIDQATVDKYLRAMAAGG
jgi:hypothetical protein